MAFQHSHHPIDATPADHARAPKPRPDREHDPVRRKPWLTAALMLAVVVGVYLVQEHWTHLAGDWIYLLLLACPLMHLFMHGGHGGHGNHHGNGGKGDGHRGPSG